MTAEQIGTAEEALGAILDACTRLNGAALNVTDLKFLAEAVQEDTRRITAMVRVALADLHARPQNRPDDDGPGTEWRRLQLIDRALRWAELEFPPRPVLDLARELEAYATGQDIPNPGAPYLLAAFAADDAADRLRDRAGAGLRTREAASAYQDGVKALRDLADTLRDAGGG